MIQTSLIEQKPCLTYRLDGPIVPKARPRHNGKQSYLPDDYRRWKEDAKLQLLSQPFPDTPLEGVGIDIALEGKHSRRGDLDNISGSILDALVAVGIVRNDNLKCIHSLTIQLNYSAKADPFAEIRIG